MDAVLRRCGERSRFVTPYEKWHLQSLGRQSRPQPRHALHLCDREHMGRVVSDQDVRSSFCERRGEMRADRLGEI